MSARAGSHHSLFFANQRKPAHVGTQNFRYRNASIRLLIVFQDRHEGATDGQPRSVERMDELGLSVFFPSCVLIPDATSSGLKSFKVAAGGDLPILVLRREPDFDVVGLRRGESDITGEVRESHTPPRRPRQRIDLANENALK